MSCKKSISGLRPNCAEKIPVVHKNAHRARKTAFDTEKLQVMCKSSIFIGNGICGPETQYVHRKWHMWCRKAQIYCVKHSSSNSWEGCAEKTFLTCKNIDLVIFTSNVVKNENLHAVSRYITYFPTFHGYVVIFDLPRINWFHSMIEERCRVSLIFEPNMYVYVNFAELFCVIWM